MLDLPQEQQLEDNEVVAIKQRRKYLVLLIIKAGLGFILLLLSVLAVKNTREETDAFGTPYYAGGFIASFALVLGCLLDGCKYTSIVTMEDTSPTALKDLLSQYTCREVASNCFSMFGGIVGIFFVAISGVLECDLDGHSSTRCKYTKNISENRNIALGILIFLVESEIVVICSIVIHCKAYYLFKPRHCLGLLDRQRAYTAIEPPNVTVRSPAELAIEPPPYNGGGHTYINDNNDFSGEKKITVDGQVIDKTQYGFQAAIPRPSQNATVTATHPPTGFPQYSNQGRQASQNSRNVYGTEENSETGTVNDLHEQNRLLGQRIAPQEPQRILMQQLQLQNYSAAVSNDPLVDLNLPPPSYESCFQDPTQTNLLQENI